MKLTMFFLLLLAGWFPAGQLAFQLYETKEGAGRPVCFDRRKSIEELERYADLIITGTVERLAPSPNDYNLYVAVVRIRRLFKPWHSNKDRQAILQNESTNRIAVINIGDPNVCRTDIKEKDTKIFFLSTASERASNFYDSGNTPSSLEFTTLPQYMLNSSVVPLTLRNLDSVEAIVKGWPAKTRKPLKPEACERKLCAFGAVCKIDGSTRRPYCDCVFNCESIFAPVCGTDNVTYTNECYLHASSCKLQRRIRVKLRSACDAKNPCDSVSCQFGAKCQVSVDGKTAHCVCPQKCYRYGDNVGSRPVCGDDGRNYESECHLQLESCRTNKEITIRYTGLCDPCANVTCPDATVCKLNPMREPVCRCSEQCPLDYKPICASDGRTYQNSCIMRIQECKLSRELRVVYNSACEKGKNPCDGIRCDFGQECFIDPFGRATCECLHRCEPVVRPVCGKDGVTYDNECELQKTACQKKIRNSAEHRGACGVGACVDHHCTLPGTVCVLRKGKPTCECPTCNDDFDPVCGSNGITYGNECKMRREACEMKRSIFVKYRGFCNGCKNKRCGDYAICIADDKGQATCQCPSMDDCPSVREPVCGTDDKTYENHCHLKVASCQSGQFITIASKGVCSACSGVECPWNARCEDGRCVCPKECPVAKEGQEVCGSDGFLYPSECHMQARACAKGMKMSVIERDRCSDEVVTVEQISESTTTEATTTTTAPTTSSTTTAPTAVGGAVVAVDGVQRCRNKTCSFAGICMDLDGDGEDECACEFDICDEPRLLRRLRAPKADPDVIRILPEELGDNEHDENNDRRSICGSDGRLYASACYMDKESCIRQTPIYQEEIGSCGIAKLEKSRHRSWASATATIQGVCECNRIGSRSNECDGTGQCPCKPGVGGRKCDQCQPGFWGLQLISKGNAGCQPCGCSAFGSDRDDCEQTTGRCVCKPGVKSSMKCDECDDGLVLRPKGCVPLTALDQPVTCDDMQCYFGAKCQMQGSRPECVCPDHCAIPAPAYSGEEGKMEVCGSNGITYGSACQLRQFACRLQMDVVVISLGACSANHKGWKPFKTTRDLVTSRTRDGSQDTLTTVTPLQPLPTEQEGAYGPGEETNERPYGLPDQSQNELALLHPGKERNADYSSSSLRLSEKGRQVGDTCSKDSDCGPLEHAFCVEHIGHKVCLCRRGYVPSQNRSQCVSISNQIEPCAQQPYPCQNGGSCIDDDTQPLVGFRCICPRGYAGLKCEKKAEKSYLYTIPRFGGHSWMEFNRMDAYSDVTMELELMIHDTDGLILYNGQKEDEKGDFISLAVVGGHVEFRYNLGDGIITFKSKEKLRLDHWHKVVASRVGKYGRLAIDGSMPITEPVSPVAGTNSHLNLRRNLYLGKVPHTPRYVVQTVGTAHGLNGCILSLKINGKIYDLRQSVSVDLLKVHNIGECGVNPCSSLPCLNGGTCAQKSDTNYMCICDPLFTGSSCETAADSCASQPCKYGGTCQPLPSGSVPFTCLCHQGRTGAYCENARKHRDLAVSLPVTVSAEPDVLPENSDASTVPEFFGRGYLELRPLPAEAERTLSIGLWLMPYKPDGLVLFSGNVNEIRGYGGGDFISLTLVDGRVQFMFNLGSGIANITSQKSLEMKKWHSIKAYRHLRNGSLQVDQDDAQTGVTPPPWDKLNLDSLPLFVGGYRNVKLLRPLVSVESGFHGAIQRISLNGVPEEKLMKAAIFVSGVGRYESPPCYPNPCRNGGTCLPKLENFECLCGLSFTGPRCEKEIGQADVEDERAVAFDGNTYLKFRNRIMTNIEGQQESNFVFRLRTNASDGLILWENRGLTLSGDYSGIALSNGQVVATFNLGKESPQAQLELRSKTRVSDGVWHIVRFWRTKRQAYLSVDDEDPPEMILSNPGATELNTDGYVWIGGSPRLLAGLPRHYYVGYMGCLDGVSIDGHRLHLTRHHVRSSRHRLAACAN